MSDSGFALTRSTQPAIPPADLDAAVVVQVAVAWAGEGGVGRRLGWWRSDFVSEFGGEDLFRRLLPATWEWAVLQAAREAARRKDAELRRREHDPDRILSIFNLGFEVDERVEERFQDLKASRRRPAEALPGLGAAVASTWDAGRFLAWARSHAAGVATTTTPVGRRVQGEVPPALGDLVGRLVAALAPLADAYPLPHFRRPA